MSRKTTYRADGTSPLTRYVDHLIRVPEGLYQRIIRDAEAVRLLSSPALPLAIQRVEHRYWRTYEVLGLDCSILEVQKLAWVLEFVITRLGIIDPLKLQFSADRYGPYSDKLRHLLNNLDGSYLHSDKRLADASPQDVIHFAPDHGEKLAAYFRTAKGAPFVEVVEEADSLIDGFQSPLGMEALATVGWLVVREHVDQTLEGIRDGISKWPAGVEAAERKQKLFSDYLLRAALGRFGEPV